MRKNEVIDRAGLLLIVSIWTSRVVHLLIMPLSSTAFGPMLPVQARSEFWGEIVTISLTNSR